MLFRINEMALRAPLILTLRSTRKHIVPPWHLWVFAELQYFEKEKYL